MSSMKIGNYELVMSGVDRKITNDRISDLC